MAPVLVGDGQLGHQGRSAGVVVGPVVDLVAGLDGLAVVLQQDSQVGRRGVDPLLRYRGDVVSVPTAGLARREAHSRGDVVRASREVAALVGPVNPLWPGIRPYRESRAGGRVGDSCSLAPGSGHPVGAHRGGVGDRKPSEEGERGPGDGGVSGNVAQVVRNEGPRDAVAAVDAVGPNRHVAIGAVVRAVGQRRVPRDIGVLALAGRRLQRLGGRTVRRKRDSHLVRPAAVGDNLVIERRAGCRRRVPIGNDRNVVDGGQERRARWREVLDCRAVDLVLLEGCSGERSRVSGPTEIGAVRVQRARLVQGYAVGVVSNVQLGKDRRVRRVTHAWGIRSTQVERVVRVSVEEQAVVAPGAREPVLHGRAHVPGHPLVRGAGRESEVREDGRVELNLGGGR